MRITSGFSNTIWAGAVGALGDVARSVRTFNVLPDGSIRVAYRAVSGRAQSASCLLLINSFQYQVLEGQVSCAISGAPNGSASTGLALVKVEGELAM